MYKNQKGFSHVAIILVFVVAAVIGVSAWSVLRKATGDKTDTTKLGTNSNLSAPAISQSYNVSLLNKQFKLNFVAGASPHTYSDTLAQYCETARRSLEGYKKRTDDVSSDITREQNNVQKYCVDKVPEIKTCPNLESVFLTPSVRNGPARVDLTYYDPTCPDLPKGAMYKSTDSLPVSREDIASSSKRKILNDFDTTLGKATLFSEARYSQCTNECDDPYTAYRVFITLNEQPARILLVDVDLGGRTTYDGEPEFATAIAKSISLKP